MILRRSALTFGVQLVQLMATVAVTVIVTRVTGASGRGTYTLVALVVSLSTLACGLGVSWASIYHIGKGTFPLRLAAGTLVTSTIASCAASVTVVGLAFALFRHSYFHELNGTQLVIGLVTTPLAQFATALGSILLGLNRVVTYSIVNLCQILTTLAVQVGLALAQHLTATSALYGWSAGTLIACGLFAWLVRTKAPLRPRFNAAIFRSYLGYGIKGYVANVMTLLNYRLDSLIVNGLIGVAQLGVYSIAVALAELLWYAANSISLVMFPHVSSLDRKQADSVTPAVARNTFLITLLAAICMFVVGRWIILIAFGPTMLPAVTPLWLLLPGIVTLSGAKVIASYLSGIGRPAYATFISGAGLVMTVILDLILIPRYGISGAAAASSVVYTATSVMALYIFVRESGQGWRETVLVQPSDLRRYRELLGVMRQRIAGLAGGHPIA